MIDKRQVRKSIHQLQVVKTWQLVVLLILMLFVAAIFLRLNNTGMVARREAVRAADKQGDIGEITARIADLQRYSSTHMNADTGDVYLQEQYNRDSRKAIEQSAASSPSGETAQQKADAICKQQFGVWSVPYVYCMRDELGKQAQADTLPQISMPNPALYRYSFASPLWSPDFAGFSVLACLLLIGAIILRMIAMIALRLMLHRHYRSL